jgi:hypothetical protein
VAGRGAMVRPPSSGENTTREIGGLLTVPGDEIVDKTGNTSGHGPNRCALAAACHCSDGGSGSGAATDNQRLILQVPVAPDFDWGGSRLRVLGLRVLRLCILRLRILWFRVLRVRRRRSLGCLLGRTLYGV